MVACSGYAPPSSLALPGQNKPDLSTSALHGDGDIPAQQSCLLFIASGLQYFNFNPLGDSGSGSVACLVFLFLPTPYTRAGNESSQSLKFLNHGEEPLVFVLATQFHVYFPWVTAC